MDYNPMNKMSEKLNIFPQVLINYKEKYFKNDFTSGKTCQIQL